MFKVGAEASPASFRVNVTDGNTNIEGRLDVNIDKNDSSYTDYAIEADGSIYVKDVEQGDGFKVRGNGGLVASTALHASDLRLYSGRKHLDRW